MSRRERNVSVAHRFVDGLNRTSAFKFCKIRALEHEQWAQSTADARTELDHLKAEHAQSRADRKARLHAQIERLSGQLDAKIERAKLAHEQHQRQFHAKIASMQERADRESGPAKAAIEARISRLRQEHERRVEAQAEAYGNTV